MATLKRLGAPSSGSPAAAGAASKARSAAAQEGMYARWEVSAPLTDTQSDSIMELAALLNERPMPKVCLEHDCAHLEHSARFDSVQPSVTCCQGICNALLPAPNDCALIVCCL